MPLRAVVFDFDGVIANSEPLHFRTYQCVLAEEGLALGEDEYYGRYLGFDDVRAFGAMARDYGVEWSREHIAALIARKAARMEELERGVSVLFPGAADLIRRAAREVPIAIASGALGVEIRRVLDRERLTSCFAAIVAAEDSPASKPAPDPYLRALALLREQGLAGADARDCVAIEDSRWGLESAREAGLRTVGVAHTYPASALGCADLITPTVADVTIDALARLCAE
jgi:beta-phosphoglucomutase